MPDTTVSAAALKKAWVAAEREAMASLGFQPLREEVYVRQLDDAGDWEAWVVLPKQSGGFRGRTVGQEIPMAGVVHRPTEELIRQLKGHQPGEGEDGVTVGTSGRDDLPEAEYPALVRLRVASVEEIPAAVAETIRTVREVYLPLLQSWANEAALAELLAAPALGPVARRHCLERRAVLHHLRGDNTAAIAAMAELAPLTTPTGIEAIDAPDRAFAEGMRARLTTRS